MTWRKVAYSLAAATLVVLLALAILGNSITPAENSVVLLPPEERPSVTVVQETWMPVGSRVADRWLAPEPQQTAGDVPEPRRDVPETPKPPPPVSPLPAVMTKDICAPGVMERFRYHRRLHWRCRY